MDANANGPNDPVGEPQHDIDFNSEGADNSDSKYARDNEVLADLIATKDLPEEEDKNEEEETGEYKSEKETQQGKLCLSRDRHADQLHSQRPSTNRKVSKNKNVMFSFQENREKQ
jgi:hypothetical protein